MAEFVYIGTAENTRNGDPLRTAYTKLNEMILELYNRPYVIGFFAAGVFDPGEVLFKHKIKEDNSFTFNESDMSFTLEVAGSGGPRVYSLTLNGTQVGTITFTVGNVNGTVDITGDSFVADKDDVIRLISPDPEDEFAEGLSVTLLGFRPVATDPN